MTPSSILVLKAAVLFYGEREIKIYRSEIQDKTIRLFAKKTGAHSKCPSCMESSGRVRSSYARTLMDLPLAAHAVFIILKVRRFACNNDACEKRIFSEKCNELTEAYSRRTARVSEYLKKFLIEISSNKGAYFSRIMNLPISSSTCLRLVKSMSMPSNDNLLCIGIDDWAKRKGMNYGTIIVNTATGRPVDLLDSRDSNDVVEWLSGHKKIEYITRDRAASYASAIKNAIPEANQIADRFHLVKNLGDAIQEEIKQEYNHFKKVSNEIYADVKSTESSKKISTIILDTQIECKTNSKYEISLAATEKRKKFLEMEKMKKDGYSISEIARKTKTDRRTIKKYLTDGIPSSVRSTRVNYSKYREEIEHMCNLEVNPTAMFKSLKNIGLNCCERSFTRWFDLNFPNYSHKWRRTCTEPLKATKSNICTNYIPLPRKLSIYVTNPEYGVAKDTGECSKEKEIVDALVAKIPLLFSLRTLYMGFRKILKGGCPDQLDTWIENVKSIGRKNINRFCKGVKKDILAVKNAILYNWTNGLVEGNVNRLKNKKREMYGRSGFELLRRKVCLSQTG